jgi:hypothetical protein
MNPGPPAANTTTVSGAIPPPSSHRGEVEDAKPSTVEEPTPVFFSASTKAAIAADFDTPRDLQPAEGLMVAFATIAETIDLYWRAAVGLGSVAACLLLPGLTNRQEWERASDGR